VPPGRGADGRQPRVVPVGVHGLLVIGEALVLGRHRGLVQPEVGGAQGPGREIHDGRVDEQTVESPGPGKRELPDPAVLLVPETGTVRWPRELVDRGRTSEASLGLPFGISVVLLGPRELQVKVVHSGVDLLSGDKTLQEDPPVFTPAGDFVVSCSTFPHRSLPVGEPVRYAGPGPGSLPPGKRRNPDRRRDRDASPGSAAGIGAPRTGPAPPRADVGPRPRVRSPAEPGRPPTTRGVAR